MQNRLKKISAPAVILILICLVLIAIGSESGKSKSGSDSAKHTVALITKSTTSAYWKSVLAGANAAGTEYNIAVSYNGPKNEEDYAMQNEMVRSAVEDGVEVIIFSAVDYNANAEAIDEAVKSGVKVIVIDSDVNSSMVSCRISTDNYLAGRMAGEAVLDGNEEQLNIGIVNFDKNSANGQQREQGFRDCVAEDKRAVIVDAVNVASNIPDSSSETKRMLEEHPEINVIVTFNEWTSLGVGYAISETGLKDTTRVIAFDSNVITVGMLETGEVDALVVQNPYAMGYLGVECAYRLINGETPESEKIDTSTFLITRDNMFDEEYQRALFPFD